MYVFEGKKGRKDVKIPHAQLLVDLTKEYHGKEHVLYADSYFTNPTVMRALDAVGIKMCGSVRSNSRGLPAMDATQVKNLQWGQSIKKTKGDMTYVVWKDKSLLKVIYNHQVVERNLTVERYDEDNKLVHIPIPSAIKDYYHHARGVDVINQLHYSYLVGRKARRCWPRLAWWLIDMCIINAFRLYQKNRTHVSHLDFRKGLMHQLVKQDRSSSSSAAASSHPQPHNGLAKEHYPIYDREEKDCKVCSHQPDNRVRSNYVCNSCKVHLCVGKCFGTFHE